jgi:hypothetical protein
VYYNKWVTNNLLQVIIPCWQLMTIFMLCKIFHLNSAVGWPKKFTLLVHSSELTCSLMKNLNLSWRRQQHVTPKLSQSITRLYDINAILKPTSCTTNRSDIVLLYNTGVCLAVITVPWFEGYSERFMFTSCQRGICALLLRSAVRYL